MNVSIIDVNRSFLIEEISPMVLVKEFKKIGITYFDCLDGRQRRKQSAEQFLTILEENHLIDQLLDILRVPSLSMTYVLDRLNNCRNAYSAGLYFVYCCFTPYFYLLSYKQPSACELYVQIVVLIDIYIWQRLCQTYMLHLFFIMK